MPYIQLKSLQVAEAFYQFVNEQVLPPLEMDPGSYWPIFEKIISQYLESNKALLQKRDRLQQQIDDWHRNHPYDEHHLKPYQQFLTDIGYLLEQPEDFKINVTNVDREIAKVAAPQLVVPINNARFALNAANARWGSLYDALYGTDMIVNEGPLALTQHYNKQRGQQVFAFSNQFLDQVIPLLEGSHADVITYTLETQNNHKSLQVMLENGVKTGIKNADQFQGYSEKQALILLFSHHDLYFELHIDKQHAIGAQHKAGLKDIILEAAVTTIEDCEDSVTAVDVADKLQVYQNWLGLVRGDLTADMVKQGQPLQRQLNPDRTYEDPMGNHFSLPGRSLMMVRNTGLHMNTDLVLDTHGKFIPEGLVDALITTLIGMHDLRGLGRYRNSHNGSIYIVKPKCHGPEEVAFCCEVFTAIEKHYQLPTNTIKMGVMDEERRTTINLKQCIHAARERIIFINTGFLDRTGDEIHTSMLAGPMLPKGEIKQAHWMPAYEDWNVDIGLDCGLDGYAQIGKGMWAMPDQIKNMYESKQAHPRAGANCAWVPSPTAATIHALHYHQVNVKQVQQSLKGQKRATVEDLLKIPLLNKDRSLTDAEIQQELDNNAQGILGYVVKWIDLGIGCSKVPDIHDTGLMEDRATLRISSQHMANWLKHEICSEQQIVDTFKRMAMIVDQQNSDTPGYINMAPAYNGIAFMAALKLVLGGIHSANGYTEDLLQAFRREVKSQ